MNTDETSLRYSDSKLQFMVVQFRLGQIEGLPSCGVPSICGIKVKFKLKTGRSTHFFRIVSWSLASDFQSYFTW
jgi:hypothetical protein